MGSIVSVILNKGDIMVVPKVTLDDRITEVEI